MKIRVIRHIVLFLLVINFTTAKAGDFEDYTWWNATHNYDGYSPWYYYLKTSAAYWGPNALPIPYLNQGLISQKYSFELRPEAHLSKGDKTYDLFSSLKIPLGERADFEVFLVPIEHFSMDSVTRHERYVRHIDASGFAGGDFWFGTNFMLLKEKSNRPSIIASAYFKTASGTAMEYIRYTDAPGYYLNLSFGKNIYKSQDKKNTLRIFGQGGFYAYQTWDPLHNQDDCVSYGLGARFSSESYWIKAALAGYYGYLDNGDRPAVIRFQLGTQREKLNFAVKYQGGIHDFKYQTIGISSIYSF